MRGAVGSPLSLHAQSNTKMHSKVCNTIQKSTWKHFSWAFWLLPSQKKLAQIGSFFNWWKCHFDHWKGCQNMPKWLKPITSHTPTLKLECLSYIMLLCRTCHNERKLRSIVFLKNSLSETPCIFWSKQFFKAFFKWTLQKSQFMNFLKLFLKLN